MKNNQSISPSEAAAALGSIKTPRKSASSSANAQIAAAARRATRKPLSEIECTCGKGMTLDKKDHAGTCPRYQAIYYRERKGLPLE